MKTEAKKDPFNWPAQNRSDLMSLSVLDGKKDNVEIKTKACIQKNRESSENLNTQDIKGTVTFSNFYRSLAKSLGKVRS
jgi:hypothetical protein